MTGRTSAVRILDDQVNIEILGEHSTIPLLPIPEHIVKWFVDGRRQGYESLSKGKGPGPLFSRHLPVVATTGAGTLFTTRLAHKGMGFLPWAEDLEEHVARYEDLLARTKDLSPEKSLAERLQGAADSFPEPGTMDSRLLGSLEIFAGETFRNISRRPLASLLFTDPESGYRSYQLDCAVQIVEPPDLRFRFLFLARSLFERDPFHITQPGVHCAYLFWVVGIHDKTPHPVGEKNVRHKL